VTQFLAAATPTSARATQTIKPSIRLTSEEEEGDVGADTKMTQLQVDDFFNPPQDTNSKFLSGCFCNRQDLNLHTYAWLPKNSTPTYAPPFSPPDHS
jgi:hypothetical protein